MKLKNGKPAIIWLNVLVFLITFIIAAIGVPLYGYYSGFSIGIIVAAVFEFAGAALAGGVTVARRLPERRAAAARAS